MSKVLQRGECEGGSVVACLHREGLALNFAARCVTWSGQRESRQLAIAARCRQLATTAFQQPLGRKTANANRPQSSSGISNAGWSATQCCWCDKTLNVDTVRLACSACGVVPDFCKASSRLALTQPGRLSRDVATQLGRRLITMLRTEGSY